LFFRTLNPGTYAIVFDNKASRFTSKKVLYSVRVHAHSIDEDLGDVSKCLSRASLPRASLARASLSSEFIQQHQGHSHDSPKEPFANT